jgi:phage tail-like protein
MPVVRDDPYGRFQFLVGLGAGVDSDGPAAGFSEVSGIGLEIEYAEYRTGADKRATPRKIPGLHRVSDVTLKRGVIGSSDLYDWLRTVADGTPSPRDVTITMLDEARSPVVVVRLLRAQPRRWVGPTLSAKGGSEVAMEELVLTAEGLHLE